MSLQLVLDIVKLKGVVELDICSICSYEKIMLPGDYQIVEKLHSSSKVISF